MSKLRGAALALVLVLFVTACGGDDPTATNDAVGADEQEEEKGERERGKAKADAGSDSDDGSEGEDDGQRVAGGTQEQPGGGEGAEDDSSSAWFPAKGIYTYEQNGFEEFCDASRCEKQDLPPTQEVKTTFKSHASNEVVVVTEAEASDSRLVRTTTRHIPDGAFITDVYLRFDYEGVTFNNSYQPDPPVEALRQPLRTGMKWSGKWEDKTSGDYVIRVGRKETVSVGDRVVQAFPLHTVTNFRGEFEGRADVTVWIDPATLAPVRSAGKIDVKSFFGRYRTEFHALLRSAPGYR